MPLAKHLEPRTYWEERSALAEEAMNRMVSIVANYCLPPAAHDDLRAWGREWDRLLTELAQKHPPPAA